MIFVVALTLETRLLRNCFLRGLVELALDVARGRGVGDPDLEHHRNA
jgi:hypothetical protein